MKFLFDFDGVLTEQTEEALRVRALFLSQIARLPEMDPGRAEQLIRSAEAVMDEHPAHHGWKVKGRITAFSNEDLFIRVNGLAACLDDQADAETDGAVARIRRQAQAKGRADFKEVAALAYSEMVAETHAGQMKPMDPRTAPVMQMLLDRGDQVVIVSNSSTDRILKLLSGVGLAAAAHDVNPQARLRVRGNAKKFELGSRSQCIPFRDYSIEVDRPIYETILKEEKPNVVVGDVFSLDLALPLHLSQSLQTGLKLYLRTRHYTPPWALEAMNQLQGRGAALILLNELDELLI